MILKATGRFNVYGVGSAVGYSLPRLNLEAVMTFRELLQFMAAHKGRWLPATAAILAALVVLLLLPRVLAP